MLTSWEKNRGSKIREAAQQGLLWKGPERTPQAHPTHSAADCTLEIWSVFLFYPHCLDTHGKNIFKLISEPSQLNDLAQTPTLPLCAQEEIAVQGEKGLSSQP